MLTDGNQAYNIDRRIRLKGLVRTFRNIDLDELREARLVSRRQRVERAKAAESIRYTSDSHGQGVHEGQPVSNELVSWVGAGRDQHCSQHFASAGVSTAGPRRVTW